MLNLKFVYLSHACVYTVEKFVKLLIMVRQLKNLRYLKSGIIVHVHCTVGIIVHVHVYTTALTFDQQCFRLRAIFFNLVKSF